MTENRRFLTEDIMTMLPAHPDYEWLDGVSEEGLYRLWQDLVNLTTLEDLT